MHSERHPGQLVARGVPNVELDGGHHPMDLDDARCAVLPHGPGARRRDALREGRAGGMKVILLKERLSALVRVHTLLLGGRCRRDARCPEERGDERGHFEDASNHRHSSFHFFRPVARSITNGGVQLAPDPAAVPAATVRLGPCTSDPVARPPDCVRAGRAGGVAVASTAGSGVDGDSSATAASAVAVVSRASEETYVGREPDTCADATSDVRSAACMRGSVSAASATAATADSARTPPRVGRRRSPGCARPAPADTS